MRVEPRGWELPGGNLEAGEDDESALVREVREETGLVVRTGDILGMWIDTYAADGPNADKVTLSIYFHATAEGTAEPHVDPNEVAEIAWFAPRELPSEIAFPGHVPAVLRAWRNAAGRGQPATLARERAAPAARGV